MIAQAHLCSVWTNLTVSFAGCSIMVRLYLYCLRFNDFQHSVNSDWFQAVHTYHENGVFKKLSFHWICVDRRQKWKILLRIQTKTDSCGRGQSKMFKAKLKLELLVGAWLMFNSLNRTWNSPIFFCNQIVWKAAIIWGHLGERLKKLRKPEAKKQLFKPAPHRTELFL